MTTTTTTAKTRRRTAILVVLAATLPLVKARDWRDVVDPELYEWVDLDPQKLIVMTEMDPFAVSLSPTMTPTYAPEIDVVERLPTDLPTLAPTEVWAMVDQNGGCEKDQVLHEIRMTDSWGDGWDETTMTITRLVDQSNLPGVVQMEKTEHQSSLKGFVEVREPHEDDPSFPHQIYRGRLAKGTEGFSYICLERNQCYQVAVDGGFWQQEIAWGIREVQLGVPRKHSPDSLLLAKGEAPETCQISLVDKETGEHKCPITCGVRTGNPSDTPTTAKPTLPPTSNPTVIRNAIPTDESSAPSDMPSLVPTSPDEEGSGGMNSDEEQDKEGAGAGQLVSSAPSDAPSLVPTGAPSDESRFGGGGGGRFGNGGGGGFGFSGGF